MANINISHIAYGSFTSSIGASTLGYSEDVSSRCRDVDGTFLDEYGRLSSSYSSLLWQYYPDDDAYILVHVQGHYVENLNMARFFSYRDASEVKRRQLLMFDFPLANVMATMPRIKYFTDKEMFPLQYTLQQHKPKAGYMADQLAKVIYFALVSGRQLYVGMQTAGRALRDNGVMETEEWNTLIEAIDKLDISLRQYASFAFCVDQNYERQVADKAVVFYVRESSLPIPADCINIPFDEIANCASKADVQESLTDDVVLLKGLAASEDVALLSYKQLTQHILNRRDVRSRVLGSKRFDSYTDEEYQMWKDLGHRLEELSIDSWEGLEHMVDKVGGPESADGAALLELNKTKSAHWPIDKLGLEKLRSLNESGLLDTDRMIRQVEQLFGNEFQECKDAKAIVRCVGKYASKSFNPKIVEQLSALSPDKDANIIEALLEECSSQKGGGQEAHALVLQGLDAMALGKARKLGANIDKWYNFLSKLSSKEERPLSQKLYLRQVGKLDGELRQQMAESLDLYATLHFRNARKYAFALIREYVKSEGKDPVVSKPECPTDKSTTQSGREASSDTAGMADRLRKFLQREKLVTLLHWAIPILLFLLVIVMLLIYFFRLRTGSDEAARVRTDYPVSVSPGGQGDHLLCMLSSFRPEVGSAIIIWGDSATVSLDISNMDTLSVYDQRYTQNEMKRDSTHFAAADFLLFRATKDNATKTLKDTIRADGSSPLLPLVLGRHERVNQVWVYPPDKPDTIRIDIPNKVGFDILGPDYPAMDLTSAEYFLWLVRTIQLELTSRNMDYVRLAY